MPTIAQRPSGGTAAISRSGRALVGSATGASVELSTSTTPGFNPLDLLYAALAGCLVLSARIAASEMGWLDRFEGARARVTGRKAADLPSRVEQFAVTLEIDGDFDAETRAALGRRAEAICTVSNTLRSSPALVHAP